MTRALALAHRGWGRVHPNPLVGAVVARGDEIVGEGWHAEFGGPHAEIAALAAAGVRARGATLYVTLEPCAHHGKQPPCTDAVIAAGIARVVIALRDPNPEAAGGVARLRAAGIPVEIGLLGDEAARQNFRFLRRFGDVTRPFVTVKLAVSMDGRIADAAGASRWISGTETRAWVHRLRAGYAAIAVGGHTALVDHAQLTARGDITPRTPPVRIVFFGAGRIESLPGILKSGGDVPVWMVLGRAPASHERVMIEAAGGTVVVAATLEEAMRELAERGIDAVLVEGGGRLAGALLKAELVDRIHQVQCPVWLGDGAPAWAELGPVALAQAPRWHTVDREVLGSDTLLTLER